MSYPALKISNVSNVCIKQMYFAKAGDEMPGHSHVYDHQTLLAHGSVRVTVGDVVKDWVRFGDNRKTIVFGATIKHCQELAKQFITAGVMAAVFTSETTHKEREELLKDYRKPDSFLKVLISVEALAKGFDVPDVGCICDARPLRKSLSTAIQMWGRGLRSSPVTGKKDCYLLDFSGNIVRFFEDFNDATCMHSFCFVLHNCNVILHFLKTVTRFYVSLCLVMLHYVSIMR